MAHPLLRRLRVLRVPFASFALPSLRMWRIVPVDNGDKNKVGTSHGLDKMAPT